jgi:hypothetical protein
VSKEPAKPAAVVTEPAAGKGKPTPTRKEQEAANRRPLVSTDKKEQKAKLNAERERARLGMAAGEEKYLPLRDRGPQKKFARDYVDARFSVGELLIPVMVLVILLSFIDDLGIQSAVLIGLWAFFVLAVIDCLVAAWLVRRKLAAKFGKDKVEKVTWYTTMRALQFRGLRLPKPQVKRWAYPEL